MDTANPINTQNTQDSQNPQGTANPRASEGDDFQSTAPSNALNEQTENLSVQKTGDPVSGSTVDNTADAIPMSWILGIVLIVLVGGFIFYKLLRESIEDSFAPAVASKAATNKTKTTTKPAKKAVAKKKSAPNQRKKSAKKRK